MSKEQFAYKKKTIPTYVVNTRKGWELLYKTWDKDPLSTPINKVNLNLDLYIPFIINKYYDTWIDKIEQDALILLLNNQFGRDVESSISTPYLYRQQVRIFREAYENRQALRLKKSKRKIPHFIPTQIKYSFIISTDILSLIYHFDNIILGEFFSYAVYDKYIKFNPLFTFDKNIEDNNNFILLANSVNEFYISSCDKGLYIEFYDMTKSGDSLLNKVKNALQLTQNKSSPIGKPQFTQGKFLIKNQTIKKEIFAYLALIDKKFSTYIIQPETIISQLNNRFFFKFLTFNIPSKSKYTSYLDLVNKKKDFGEITAKYKNVTNNVEIYITRSLGRASIKKFQAQFNALIDYYNTKISSVLQVYTELGFKTKISITKKSKIKGKTSLKKLYPNIFPKTGYSTNCGPKKQPAVIQDEKEIKTYESKPNKILKFPASETDKQQNFPMIEPFTDEFGTKSHWFVCDKKNIEGKIPAQHNFIYPGLGKTRAPQNYQKVPCCFIKSQEEKASNVTQSYTKGFALCKNKNVCALPPLLLSIFNILDPAYKYHRQGSTNNILDSLNIVFNKKIKFKDILNFKNLGISKQENWDIEDIRAYLDKEKYIDPKRFIRVLEEVYDCKIFIFERKTKIFRSVVLEREMPMLLIPRHNLNTNYYTFNYSDRKTIILFSHLGTETDNISLPHYEIIFRVNWDNDPASHKYSFNSKDHIIIKLHKLFNMLNESFCLKNEISPFMPLDIPSDTQIIDYNKF